MKIFGITGSVTIIILVFSILISIPGCSREVKTAEKDFRITDDESVTYLLEIIRKINSDSPESFTGDFDIEGHSAGQKFKASGNVQFNNDPRKMRIIFHDAVFKSPITEMAQEGDILKFYFPFDKILYIDNVKTIKLKSYTSVDLDFNFISDLSSGHIRVLKNYSIIKGLECESDTRTGNNKLIILENNEYYETISFIREIPDKILFLNKKTQEKIEVYLKEPESKENLQFYKEIRIISPGSDLNISVKYNSMKFNIPVDLENIAAIKLPKDARVINKHN